jgi:coenzyme PQQ precursor peptide PqqA
VDPKVGGSRPPSCTNKLKDLFRVASPWNHSKKNRADHLPQNPDSMCYGRPYCPEGRIVLNFECQAHQEEHTMAWNTPELVEICIGMEINAYAPAEF